MLPYSITPAWIVYFIGTGSKVDLTDRRCSPPPPIAAKLRE